MLSHKLSRSDASSGRSRVRGSFFRRPAKSFGRSAFHSRFAVGLALFCLFTLSCGSPAIDVRTVLPGDALIYLETRDLGRAIATVTESAAFQNAAKTKPDLGSIHGIELGVAVTGFETSEKQITEENSVLSFQPRFVAAAETRLWNFQVISFVEHQLGLFISEAYGGEALLETFDKYGGKYFVWTAQDGRKAFALVDGGSILFGNDESAIEKCLAVKRGEIESIAKNPRVAGGDRLAFGFISSDGIAQLSNIAGLTLAKRSSDEAEVQSFIARVLPELLRNSLKGLDWTMRATENGIEDRFKIETSAEIATVLNETIKPAGGQFAGFEPFMNQQFDSVTRYDLTDPRIAWRSVVLTAQKQIDPTAGSLLSAFSDSIFEPYGVDNGELFLSAIGSNAVTIRFDPEGERQVVIADVRGPADLKKAVAAELRADRKPDRRSDADYWATDDGDVAMVLVDGKAIIGDPESVIKCLESYRRGPDVKQAARLLQIATSNAPAATLGYETGLADRIADVISEKKEGGQKSSSVYFVETRFNSKGIERLTISDLGFIGTIVAQFAQD